MGLNWWQRYQDLVRGKTIERITQNKNEVGYWQDLLFFNFLFYCLPVSFVAVIPGIFMAINDGYTTIAIVDLFCLVLLSLVTFSHWIPLNIRKVFIIIIFYLLSVFLINLLGYIGPGIFYLFAITILMALVFPRNYGYWSIFINSSILLSFALIIRFNLFHCALVGVYTPGMWIAFSSNLIFLSIVLVALINRIFKSLQHTINKAEQSQERYKSIFERSPMPMWIFDVQTLKFLYVNQAAIRHYGYTEDEFLQMTIQGIRPEEDAPVIHELVKTNRESGIFYHGTVDHIKKDGLHIKVKVESNLLMFDQRQVRLVLATDVTEQLKSENEVYQANMKTKKSEANLRAIFESAADGFVLVDEDLMIKAFNTRAKEYIQLNKRHSELETGKSILDYMEHSRHAYFISAIQKVYHGELIEYDRRYRADGGAIQWIHFTLTPVYDDQIVRGVCITGRDITVRKSYLQNLEDQNKTFRDISWMQSHLVRAPLARIMGLAGLLKSSPEELHETIDFIQQSANELDDVIRKITDQSNQLMNKYPVTDDDSSKKMAVKNKQ